jgi:putative membrane protein
MMGFGFGGLGMIFMLVFWVVIIALAVWLLSNIFPRATNSSSLRAAAGRSDLSESPLEILKQRYARGEINREQYELMKHEISEDLG